MTAVSAASGASLTMIFGSVILVSRHCDPGLDPGEAISCRPSSPRREIAASRFALLAMTSLHRRPAHRLRRLEGAGGAQHARVGVQRADDLQPDRQTAAIWSIWGEPARDRGG